jgi:hypothetical protein
MRSQDPFLHPAVGKVIKAVWYEGSSRKPALASRFNNRYQCSIEGCNEKEIPEAMVTVAATAVCMQIIYPLFGHSCYCQIEAALIDCSNQSTAGKVPRSDFSAGTFGELHTWHCDLLGGIRVKNRRLYHRILSTIYNAVMLVLSFFLFIYTQFIASTSGILLQALQVSKWKMRWHRLILMIVENR